MGHLRKERDFGAASRWIAVASSVLLLAFVLFAITRFSGHTTELSASAVSKAVRSSVLQCYALEGAYPPDLAYLEKNYGLLLDRTRYLFLYEVPGSNIFPIVEVTLR